MAMMGYAFFSDKATWCHMELSSPGKSSHNRRVGARPFPSARLLASRNLRRTCRMPWVRLTSAKSSALAEHVGFFEKHGGRHSLAVCHLNINDDEVDHFISWIFIFGHSLWQGFAWLNILNICWQGTLGSLSGTDLSHQPALRDYKHIPEAVPGGAACSLQRCQGAIGRYNRTLFKIGWWFVLGKKPVTGLSSFTGNLGCA